MLQRWFKRVFNSASKLIRCVYPEKGLKYINRMSESQMTAFL